MAAYNHEKFIAQAIESVLMQQTNFDYELVIGEDCSTDGTRGIVMAYRDKHPDRIRLLLHEKNVGMHQNSAQTFKACRGQYIAFLEGDDYWISPQKLQMQADFLDNHPDFTFCFSNVLVVDEDRVKPELFYKTPMKTVYGLEDLLTGNFIHTPSVMARNGVCDELPEWHYRMPMGDWAFYLLNAQRGPFGYINEVLAAYRKHAGGTWSSQPPIQSVENNITARLIVRREFKGRSVGADLHLASLLRQAFDLWMQAGDHQRASVHARRLIPLRIRCLAHEIYILLRTVLRADHPRVWRVLKRLKEAVSFKR